MYGDNEVGRPANIVDTGHPAPALRSSEGHSRRNGLHVRDSCALRDRLFTMLAPLLRVEDWGLWDDYQIPPVSRWEEEWGGLLAMTALGRSRHPPH